MFSANKIRSSLFEDCGKRAYSNVVFLKKIMAWQDVEPPELWEAIEK